LDALQEAGGRALGFSSLAKVAQLLPEDT